MQIKASFSYVNLESLSQTTENAKIDWGVDPKYAQGKQIEADFSYLVSYRRTRHPNHFKSLPKTTKIRITGEFPTDAQGIQIKANFSYLNLAQNRQKSSDYASFLRTHKAYK